MKSERFVLGAILIFLVGVCSFSYVSAENIISEIEEIDNEEKALIEKIENDDDDSDELDDDSNSEPNDDENDNTNQAIEIPLLIKAVSAGGKNNVGEFIELINLSEEPLLLTNISIIYENTSGKNYSVYEFIEDSTLAGNNLLLRLASSENSDESDLTYSKDLAQKGGKVSLVFDDIVFDSVCWGEIEDCENSGFKSDNPTVLVRDFNDESEKYLNTFSHKTDYVPEWEENRIAITFPEEEIVESICQDLEFSELFTYFESGKNKQFIEFFNPTAETIDFSGCYLEYKTEIYPLSGRIDGGQYFVFYPDFALTKNPTKSNTVALHDIDDSEVDSLTYFNGQKKETSFAKFYDEFGAEIWQQTYAITPGTENVYQQFRSCEEGKIINEKTGKCVFADDEDDENEEKEVILPVCKGIQFSEILSFYESEKSEQFIEFFNPTSDQIILKGCNLRYKNKLYALDGIVRAEEYFSYFPTAFVLTKNPTSSNKLEIVDADGSIVDSLVYYNGQKKGVSFAQFGTNSDGSEIWEQTYSPTPGEENNFQRFKTCEAGKVINEETGNCVKITTITTALAECPAGSYRNPLTNRCKKYSTATSGSTLKECAEGYERNPETNRCRKIVNNDGADFEIQAEDFEEQSSFVAIWAIAAVASLGALYVVFEYRNEIAKLITKKRK